MFEIWTTNRNGRLARALVNLTAAEVLGYIPNFPTGRAYLRDGRKRHLVAAW